MSILSKILPAAIAGFLLSATPALADAITVSSADIGQSYTLNYNGFSGSTTISGLTGSTTLTLTAVTPTSYTFSYGVDNTSAAPITDSRISGFAFNTDPTISSATSTGTFQYTTLNQNYPNGIGTVDVCFQGTQTGSCAGNGGTGVGIADPNGTGSFTLNFSSPISSLTMSDFFVRYQSITGAGNITSASGAGTLTSSGGSTSSGGTVPEPGMFGLMGGAAAVVMLLRRRQRTSKQRVPAYA